MLRRPTLAESATGSGSQGYENPDGRFPLSPGLPINIQPLNLPAYVSKPKHIQSNPRSVELKASRG